MKKISVVIPTFKRPSLLKNCLLRLNEQTFKSSDFEIIVVSDGKDQQTKSLLSHLYLKPILRYYTLSTHKGPAAARNLGWKKAKSAIIAFTDDDCLPDIAWLQNGYKYFQKGAQVLSGGIKVPIPSNPTDYEKNVSLLEKAEFVTANCFIKKSILKKLNGFDESFKMAWREDADLQFRLLEQFFPIAKADTAVILHPVRKAKWAVSLEEQKKSQYNALLYKKHPALYRSKIQAGAPLPYYAVILALIILVGGIIFSQLLFILLGIFLWLILTINLSLKRLSQTSHSPIHTVQMLITSAFIPPLSIFWRLFGAIKFKVFFF